MRTRVVISSLMLFVAASAWACPKGSSEYRGECVVDLTPEIAPSVKPSNEKPPQTHNDPWRNENINVINAPNMQESDWKQDLEKAKADADGKKAAGLR